MRLATVLLRPSVRIEALSAESRNRLREAGECTPIPLGTDAA